MAGIDGLLLLAFVIISVIFGKPLSFLNCMNVANATPEGNAAGVAAFTQSLATNMGKDGSTLGLWAWAGSTRVNCFETKAIWGLCISLWYDHISRFKMLLWLTYFPAFCSAARLWSCPCSGTRARGPASSLESRSSRICQAFAMLGALKGRE